MGEALDEAHAPASSTATQAREHPDRPRQHGLPRRLRPRQARLEPQQPDRRAGLRRDDRVRRAAADQGQAGRRPRGRLLPRHASSTSAAGTDTVRTRERAGRPLRAPARARAPGQRPAARTPAGWTTCCEPATAKEPKERYQAAPSWWRPRAARSRASAGRGRPAGARVASRASLSPPPRGDPRGDRRWRRSPRRRRALAVGGDGIALVNARTPSPHGSRSPAPLGPRLRQALRVGTAGRPAGSPGGPAAPRGRARGGAAVPRPADRHRRRRVYVTEQGGGRASPRRHAAREGHGPVDGRDPRRALLGPQRDRRGRRLGLGRARGRGRPRGRGDRPGAAPLPAAGHGHAAAFADGDIWAASSENGLVEKIDPESDRVIATGDAARVDLRADGSGRIGLGRGARRRGLPAQPGRRERRGQTPPRGEPESLAAAPGALWVAGSRDRALTRLDIGRARRTTIALSRVAASSCATATGCCGPRPSRSRRCRPRRRARRSASRSGDGRPAARPGVRLAPRRPAPLRDLHEARELPGRRRAAGQRLRPEAAAALPARSADGRTYTFQIRERHALLAAVGRAGDRRRVRGRSSAPSRPSSGPTPPALTTLGDMVGARRTAGRRPRERDRRPRHPALDHPDAAAGDLLPACDAALLRGAGRHAGARPGDRADPSAGRTTSAPSSRQAVLDRNPNYRGPRPRRPARIVYLTGMPTAKGVALAGAGQADVVPWDYDLQGPLAPEGRSPAAPRPAATAVAAPGVDMSPSTRAGRCSGMRGCGGP